MLPRKILSISLLIIAGMFYQNVSVASNVILEDHSIVAVEGGIRLVVNFSQPVSYLSHFPSSKGKSLEIKLRPLQLTTSRLEQEVFMDKLPISPHQPTTITDLRYEQDTSKQGQLSIQFSHSVSFTVQPARDRRSLTIITGKLKQADRKNKTDTRKTITQPSITPPDSGLTIYTLNLESSSQPIDLETQTALKDYDNYDIYTTSSQLNWQNKFQLRLGYFYSRKAAEAIAKQLKQYYPNAWVDKIKAERKQVADSWFIRSRPDPVSANKLKAKPSKLERLVERGKQAMIDKKYRNAIRYFSRILQFEQSEYHRQALELLGLARERNKQFAHAKAEYQQYLKLYPQGEDAERVRQRLTGLITARSGERKKLQETEQARPEPEWSIFGSVSQFYRNQVSKTDVGGSNTVDSSLLSDVVYSGRKRGDKWNQRFDFVGNHRYDFQSEIDAENANIYTLFYDLSDKENDFSIRAGRQTHNSDGVLGRFDGIIVRKRISNKTRVNLLAGYPVELSVKDSINTTRQFYAVSMDFESIIDKLDGKLFYSQQQNSGLTDRTAIGTQFQYIDESQSLFLLVDHDTYFGELNQAIFVGNWRSKANSTLSIVADTRNNPILTTNNAIIGQTTPSIEQLKSIYTEDEIKQLALDRTAQFKSLTVAATTPLSDRYQLNGDVSVTNIDGTPASGGVAATQGTGNEYFYNLSLIANGFFLDNDITIMGLKYIDAATSSTTGINISTRFKSSKPWRWNPRLTVSQRNDDNGTERMTYKARIIVNYIPSRNWRFEVETGYETSDTSNPAGDSSEENTYIFLGYIHDF